MPVTLSDLHDPRIGETLYVSENLHGRVVVPNYDPNGDTLVLMHHRAKGSMPSLRYDLTDEGHLRLRLPEGEVVLCGVRDPADVRVVLRAH